MGLGDAWRRTTEGGDFISGKYEFGQDQDIARFETDRAGLEGLEGTQAAQTFVRQHGQQAQEAAGTQAQAMIGQLQSQLQSGALSPSQFQRMIQNIQSGTQSAAGGVGSQALDAWTQLRDHARSEIQDRLTQARQFGQQATLQEWQTLSSFLGGGQGTANLAGMVMGMPPAP